MTPQETARAFHDAFEIRTRHNGRPFLCLKDGSPQWMTDIAQAAHGDMMPDDVRYSMIYRIASDLENAEDWEELHELIDGNVDVYTYRLTEWLASHVDRVGYCDTAFGEGLVNPDHGLVRLIAAGQYQEYSEIAYSLVQSLTEQAEAEDNS